MPGWTLVPRTEPSSGVATRAYRIAFYVFVGTLAFSVAGSLALYIPQVHTFFAPMMTRLIQTPTWIYMALLPVLSLLLYRPALGWPRSLAFFVWGSLIGAASELAGTTTGLPFGPYAYTNWLGPQLFGHVPYFIPPSWYALAILSYDLAHRIGQGRAARIVGGALLMVLWDVALDPAMSKAFPFWQYPGHSPTHIEDVISGWGLGWLFVPVVFGMPLMNWIGWFVTAAVIMLGFEYLLRGLPQEPTGERHTWAWWLFALNLLFPISISLLYSLPLAALLGVAALGLAYVLVRRPALTLQPEPA